MGFSDSVRPAGSSLVAALVFGGLAAPAHADWQITPKLGVEFLFESNPLLRSEGGEAVFSTTLQPGLVVALTDPVNTLVLDLAGEVARSSGDGLDGQNGERLDRSSQHFLGQYDLRDRRSTFSFNAGLTRSTTRSGDVVAETGVLAEQATRQSILGSVGWRYRLSARDSVRLFSTVDDTTFDSDAFTDYRTFGGGIAYEFQVDRRNEATVQLTYEHLSSTSSHRDSVTLETGWTALITRDLSVSLGVGVLIADSHVGAGTSSGSSVFDPAGEPGVSVNRQLSAAVIWIPTRFDRFELAAESGSAPNTFGELSDTDSVGVTYERKITQTVSFHVIGAWRRNTLSGQARTRITAEPGLSWRLRPELNLELRYTYDRLSTSDDAPAHNNAVMIALTYRPDFRLGP